MTYTVSLRPLKCCRLQTTVWLACANRASPGQEDKLYTKPSQFFLLLQSIGNLSEVVGFVENGEWRRKKEMSIVLTDQENVFFHPLPPRGFALTIRHLTFTFGIVGDNSALLSTTIPKVEVKPLIVKALKK